MKLLDILDLRDRPTFKHQAADSAYAFCVNPQLKRGAGKGKGKADFIRIQRLLVGGHSLSPPIYSEKMV